jgi:murein DD-endopeptidase MepM/ murein hydrolase activator NlpD
VLGEEAAQLRRRLDDARRNQDQMTSELDLARARVEALALQARSNSEAKALAERSRAEAAIEAAQLRRTIEEQRQSKEVITRQLLTAEERAAAAAAEAKTNAALAEQTAALELRLEVARMVQEALASRLDDHVTSQVMRVERAIARTGLNVDQLLATGRSRDRPDQGGPLISLAPPFSHINVSLAKDDVERSPQLGRVARGIERIEALRQVMEALPAGSPVGRLEISSGFGLRVDPLTRATAVHPGTDLRANVGTPVRVMAPGVVRSVSSGTEYGNLIEVRHAHGVVTRYAHLSSMDVGQVIGKVGMTGRSTGAHLHYEVRIDSNPRNPLPFLELDRNALPK